MLSLEPHSHTVILSAALVSTGKLRDLIVNKPMYLFCL